MMESLLEFLLEPLEPHGIIPAAGIPAGIPIESPQNGTNLGIYLTKYFKFRNFASGNHNPIIYI